VTLNGVFTSNFSNYFLTIQFAASATTDFRSRFTAAGTPDSTSNYTLQQLNSFSTTVGAARLTGQTFFLMGGLNTSLCVYSMNIYAPNTSNATGIISQGFRHVDSPQNYFNTGGHTVSTVFDGIQLIPETGTITGTIRVYGYQNS
jgi:hypothetical protein